MAALFSAFLSGNVAGICEGQPKLPVDVALHPFQVGILFSVWV